MCLTKFKNNQNLLIRIIHWSLTTTKLFTGWNITIDQKILVEFYGVDFVDQFS